MSVYTRSDVSQSWVRAVAQANKPIEREGHEVTGFALDEGIIGGRHAGAVEVDKPAQPLPMHDGQGLKASVMAIPIVCDGKVWRLEAALKTRETSIGREKSCPTWRTSWAKLASFLSARRWNSSLLRRQPKSGHALVRKGWCSPTTALVLPAPPLSAKLQHSWSGPTSV